MSFGKYLVCSYCKRPESIDDEAFPEKLYDLITECKVEQLLWVCKTCKRKPYHSCCSSTDKLNEIQRDLLEVKENLRELTAEIKKCSSFVAEQYSYANSIELVKSNYITSVPATSPLHVDVSSPLSSKDNSPPSSSFSPKKNRAAREMMQSILKNQIKINVGEASNSKRIVNSVFDALITALKNDDLFKHLYEKPYYTGSSYNDLRVASATEFDIDIELHLPRQFSLVVEFFDCTSAFAKIRWEVISELPEDKICILKFLESNSRGCYLESAKITSWFQSLLDKYMSKLEFSNDIKQVKNRKSGPARTIQVETNSLATIYIDLVPVFGFKDKELDGTPIKNLFKKYPDLKDNTLYLVPKECSGEVPMDDLDFKISWRVDLPNVEKCVLHDKQCTKPIIKLIKLLRDKLNWKGLASYHIKTLMLWEVDRYAFREHWSNSFLFERFLEVLKSLHLCLKNKNLPYFFDSELNLLHKLSEKQCENWSNHLNGIISSIESDHNALQKIYCP